MYRFAKSKFFDHTHYLVHTNIPRKRHFCLITLGYRYRAWNSGYQVKQHDRPLTLYSTDTHFNASRTDSFRKHCDEQFLLFQQCFQLNQVTVSPYVHIFDIISLFAVELKKRKIGISGKGLIESITTNVTNVTWGWHRSRSNCTKNSLILDLHHLLT